MKAKEDDIQKMLACQVHIGTKNLEVAMTRYIWKRRTDGIYLIDLQKTWEKLQLAARIIVAIENPQDICVISSRTFGQRAVLKFAKYTGAQALTSRYTPGTLTNQIQDKFMEPRLLVVTDPRTDHQPVRESSYVNIPVIAFCHTNTPLTHVDVAIPCNNMGRHAIGLMWWLLAREVLYLRNTPSLTRGKPWDVMVDLFLYRDPEEAEDKEEQGAETEFARPATDNWAPATDWGASVPGTEWGTDASGTAAAVPAGGVAAGGGGWDNSVINNAGNWDSPANE